MVSLLNPEVIAFPSIEDADEDGLLAIGGDLTQARLLHAYKLGIFPWYSEDEPICWWSPDPRCVLFPDDLNVSKSMRPVLNGGAFKFTINRNFNAVISNCRKAIRSGEPGTWITDEIIDAYSKLHLAGYAHSAETWQDGRLVGGLYGVRLGKVFFGESMFSSVSNASKFAFIHYLNQLVKEGVRLIDCQVYSPHLLSLGASLIPRSEFNKLLQELI